ncbi:hypothetical protein DFH28DRAFT_1116929 [Melampsora americana]|nr:hypothetical protein DFH28DRAFT_1116929 [Melampsora americana]
MRNSPIWMLVTAASIYGNVFSALLDEPKLVSTSEHLLASSLPASDPVSGYTSAEDAEETPSLVSHQNLLTGSIPIIEASLSHEPHSEPSVPLSAYQIGRPVLQPPSHPEHDILVPIYQLGPAPVLHPSPADAISATFHPASSFGMPPAHIIPWNQVFESSITEEWSHYLHLGHQIDFPHQPDSIHHVPDVPSLFILPYHHISPYPYSSYPNSLYPHILDHPGTSSEPHISHLVHSVPDIENPATNGSPFTSFLLNPDAPPFYPVDYPATRKTKSAVFHRENQRLDDDFGMRSKDAPPDEIPQSSTLELGDTNRKAPPTSLQGKRSKKKLRKIKNLLESTPSGSSSQKTEQKPVAVGKKSSKPSDRLQEQKSARFEQVGFGETETSLAKEILIGEHLVNIDSPRAKTPTNSLHLAPAHDQGLSEHTTGPRDQLLQDLIPSEESSHKEKIEVEREPKEAKEAQGRPFELEHAPVLDVKPPNLFLTSEDNTGSKWHSSTAGRQSTIGPYEDHSSQRVVSSEASSHHEGTEFEREPESAQGASSKHQDQHSVLDEVPVLDVKGSKLDPAPKDVINSNDRVSVPLSLYEQSSASIANSGGKQFFGQGLSSSNFLAKAKNPEKLKNLAKSSTPATPVGRELSQRPRNSDSVRSVITTNEDRKSDMIAAFDTLRVQTERSKRFEDAREESSGAHLYSSLENSIDSSSTSESSGIDTLLESGVINQEKLKSSINPVNARVSQRRVRKASKLYIPEYVPKSRKKATESSLEDLNFADPSILPQKDKLTSKSGLSKTRPITMDKGKDIKLDAQASTSVESPTVGRDFWSNVAPMISHLRVKTPLGYLPSLPSSTSRFLESLKKFTPWRWLGKNERDESQVEVTSEATKDIDRSERREVLEPDAAIGDGESSSSIANSPRVRTNPSRRKRKKNLLISTGVTSADINVVENHKDLLEDGALDAVAKSLQIDDDREFLRIDLQQKDYDTLRARDNTDWEAIRTWVESQSRASEEELERRFQVLSHQLQYYDIRVRYDKIQKSLDATTKSRWNELFRIQELCPTLTHIDPAHDTRVKMTLDVALLSKPEKFALTKVLGDSELRKRVDLINYMRQRDINIKWWGEDELQDARWQGLNVLNLLQIGDLLRFGQPQSLGFAPNGPKTTAILMYGTMLTRKTDPEVYPIHARSWGESPEREWFLQHPTLKYEYQERMKSLIMRSDFEIIKGSKILQNLQLPSESPWWSLGDFLMWNDEGVQLGKMGIVASRVGNMLELTKFKRLTLKDLETLNWKSVFKGIDSNTRSKAKEIFFRIEDNVKKASMFTQCF